MNDPDTDGLVSTLTAEPKAPGKDDQDLLDAAESFQKGLSPRVTGDDEDEEPTAGPKRRASVDDDDEDEDTPPRRSDLDDDDEDEEADEFDDDDAEASDGEEDEDDLVDDEDDDDLEMRRPEQPSRGLRTLAKEFGLEDERDARRGFKRIVEDFRATVNTARASKQPNQDQTKPPADTAHTAFSDEDMKEFEELNPAAAKVVKGLLRQVETVQQTVLANENRRAMVQVNRVFDKVAKKYGLAKQLGESGRTASTGQREARRKIIAEAYDYVRTKEQSGRPVSLVNAIRAAAFDAYQDEILRAERRGATDKLVRLAKRRERQFDLVPKAGSVPRRRESSEGGDERSLLRAAALYQKQNNRRRIG